MFDFEAPDALFSRRAKTNQTQPVHFLRFTLCLAVYGRVALRGSPSGTPELPSGKGEEDAAGADGSSLFDLLLSLSCDCGTVCFVESKYLTECCICLRKLVIFSAGNKKTPN